MKQDLKRRYCAFLHLRIFILFSENPGKTEAGRRRFHSGSDRTGPPSFFRIFLKKERTIPVKMKNTAFFQFYVFIFPEHSETLLTFVPGPL